MKKYYKDGIIVMKPNSLIFNGITYVPPTDEILMEAGYEIVEEEEIIPQLTNEIIAEKRAIEYANRADRYLLAYQAYLTLGEIEKAEENKKIWLSVREEIDKELPYLNESEEIEYVNEINEEV
jgi:hypothetical protein